MRRRELLVSAASSFLISGLPSHAWSREPARIGVLWHARDAKEEAPFQIPFLEGFRDLGYRPDVDVRFEHRYADEQYDRFNALAEELVGLKPDVLVAVTRPAAEAAKKATSVIPIVFIVVPDPVGSGLVDSLAKPGGNVTGLSNVATDLTTKRLSILKEAVPTMRRVVLLLNPTDAGLAHRFLEDSRAVAARLGLQVFPIEVRSRDDIDSAFEQIDTIQPDGLVINNDPMIMNERAKVNAAANARRLPAMLFIPLMVKSGGLMSYSPDIPGIFRHTATLVDRILKGVRPSDLPVEQPDTFRLTINMRTAESIGLSLAPELLARADEVVE
jgi:putative ABC transport system substrate-binding protein